MKVAPLSDFEVQTIAGRRFVVRKRNGQLVCNIDRRTNQDETSALNWAALDWSNHHEYNVARFD